MVNAMHSEKQTPEIVNSSCAVVVDFCTGDILEPLPGARFRRMGRIDNLEKFAKGEDLVISVDEAARRIGCKRKTLYNWIESDPPKLTEKQGLRPMGKRWRIDWAIFRACFDRGEIPPCS